MPFISQRGLKCLTRFSHGTFGDLGGRLLTAVNLVHTVIWAILAASIVAVPVAGVLRRFGWAAVLTAVIVIECGVLALNPQHSFRRAIGFHMVLSKSFPRIHRWGIVTSAARETTNSTPRCSLAALVAGRSRSLRGYFLACCSVKHPEGLPDDAVVVDLAAMTVPEHEHRGRRLFHCRAGAWQW